MEKIMSLPEKALLSLMDEKVKEVALGSGCLTITFESGVVLTAAAKSGPGADGGWYSWTHVSVETPEGRVEIINE